MLKPINPALQPAHPFAADLVGAWLFTETSGHTVPDLSGFDHHLAGTGYSLNDWVADGLLLGSSYLTPGSTQSDFNFTAAQPWTQIFWHRRTGPGHAGPFDRLSARIGNVVDMALQANDNYGPAYFNGGGWINPQQGSSVSGADSMWAFAYTGALLNIYKDGALVDSRAQSVAATGKLYLNSPEAGPPPTQEYLDGVWLTSFFHRRAIDATELASHYSDPFAAFIAVASPSAGGTFGLGFNFNLF